MDSIITFTTESGSIYELDIGNKRIRRMMGSSPPTPHQGADGQWFRYMAISPPEVGGYVNIVWCWENSLLKTTMTSNVVHVEKMAQA